MTDPQTNLKCLEVVQIVDGKEMKFKMPDILSFEEVSSEYKSETDLCRAEFEAWYCDDPKWTKSIEKNSLGDYELMQTRISYTAWEAGWNARA